MKHVYCCFLVLLVAARGSAQTECRATNEGTLKCQFSENINTTQRDFSIYFDPDYGHEEQLVACLWIKSQLRCITQKDFEFEGLVSTTALFTIPRSVLSRNGSYRCVHDGYQFNATSCRVQARRDLEHFAACEANSNFDGHHLFVKCIFSFDVEGFSIIYNSSVVAKYTKSSCKEIYPECSYKQEESNTEFSLKFNTSKYQFGEYFCHPDTSPYRFEVKGCIAAKDTITADLSALPWYLLTAVCLIVLPLMTMVLVVGVIYFKKIKGKKEKKGKERRCVFKRLLWSSGTEDIKLKISDDNPTSV